MPQEVIFLKEAVSAKNVHNKMEFYRLKIKQMRFLPPLMCIGKKDHEKIQC